MARCNIVGGICLALAISVGAAGNRAAAQSTGPDVIAGELWDTVLRWGTDSGITGYSLGSIACNPGSTEVSWVATDNRHPVQATQLYRLKNGRFEQIGMAWAMHEYLALAYNDCNLGCITPNPYTGLTLGVGCSNPDNASVNGKQTRLGPRGHVNAFTGVFPYPFTQVPYPPPGSLNLIIGRRLQVHDVDLNPSLNPGALYFAEMQYIAADDASAGNAINNASYRQVTVTDGGAAGYKLNYTGQTFRETTALHAWQVSDVTVQETVVQVPYEGRFTLAAKATDLGGGTWHYEYAMHNMNSDRSGRSFFVPVPGGVSVTNIGFHDVDYHSGDSDPYAPGAIRDTDWPSAVGGGGVTWQTDAWNETDRQANALRWGTVYNFRFDANRQPATGAIGIALYKPGTPAAVGANTLVPEQAGGACCLPDGSCLPNAVTAVCTMLGGTHRGSGSGCDPNPCGQPATGACCGPTLGVCTINTEGACAYTGGTYQGNGTVCDPNPCPQPPTGACCSFAEGTCTVLSQSACAEANGAYRGDETDCDPDPCGGACCLADLSCTPDTTASECNALEGQWRGTGSQCAPEICIDPPIPTISDFGNAAMVLLFLAAGALAFRRRGQPVGVRQETSSQ